MPNELMHVYILGRELMTIVILEKQNKFWAQLYKECICVINREKMLYFIYLRNIKAAVYIEPFIAVPDNRSLCWHHIMSIRDEW